MMAPFGMASARHPPRREDGGETLMLDPAREVLLSPLRIRLRAEEDLAGILQLLRRAYPPSPRGPAAPWTDEVLREQMRRFPEGQWVARRVDGRLLGTASCMRVDLRWAMAPHTWAELTAEGTLSTHDPMGNALYGVGLAVDPAFQGLGIGRSLTEARLDMGALLGCRAFVAGARMAGYRHARALGPQGYLAEVKAGRLWDPTLSKEMALGFELLGVLPAYAPDPESEGYAALVYKPL